MLDFNSVLDAFDYEEIDTDQICKGDIFKSIGRARWEVAFDIEVKDWDRNQATKRINIKTSCYGISCFYNHKNIFETVKIIKRGTYNVNLVIDMIEKDKEEHRLQSLLEEGHEDEDDEYV